MSAIRAEFKSDDHAVSLVRPICRRGRDEPLHVGPPASWQLLALSGGRPVDLAGEWDEDGVVPSSVWAGDRLIVV